MASEIILRIEGVEAILKKLDPAILAPVVTDGLGEIADALRPEIQSRVPRDTGLLAGSIRIQLDKWRTIPEYVKVGPTRPHTHLVELGVAPGHFPPWDDTRTKSGRRLRSWVKRHISPTSYGSTVRKTNRKVTRLLTAGQKKEAQEAALDRATFLVARAIFRRGIPGKFFLVAAAGATESQLQGVIDDMVAHLEGEWEKVGGLTSGE